MMSLVVVIGLVAACTATPTFRSSYLDGPHYYGSYYPAAVVSPIKSQYHAQNEQGGYAYGYNDGYSTKSETKHPNGLTEGSYSYVDPNGVLQAYKYVSDENGYRVTGTNLPVAPAVPVVQHAAAAAPAAPAAPAVEAVAVAAPVYDAAAEIPQPVQDTPEVAAAKAAHQAAYEQAKKAAEQAPADDSSSHSEPASDAVEVSAAPAVIKTSPAAAVSYGYPAYAAYPSYAAYAAPAPVAASYAYAAAAPAPAYSYTVPVASYAYASAPAATYGYAAPFAAGSYSPVHSQYHSQDEFGQYSYGYNSGSSSKAEVKTLDGITRGGYSYVDANGVVQQYNYVSDPINGFRVAGTNLPSNSL